MKMKILLVGIIAMLLVVAGCNQAKPETRPNKVPPVDVQNRPAAETAPATSQPPVEQSAITGDKATDSVGATVSDIGMTDSELADPALQDLDKELTSLDW